jgi:outer membrane protein
MHARLLFLVSAFLFTSQPAAVFANTDCKAAPAKCVEVGKWQLNVAAGAGVRTNPILGGKDIPLVVLPELSYSGKRFFIQNLDLGYTVWENPDHQLNLLITPSLEQVYFHRWSPGNFVLDSNVVFAGRPGLVDSKDENSGGNFDSTRIEIDMSRLHKRRMAALGGLEYSVAINDWTLQAQWLTDISGVHEGEEARFAVARHYYRDRHSLSVSLGASWQSAELINYYYGILRDEVTLADHAYSTDAGISTIARLDWGYSINDRWSLRFTGIYRQLADEIHLSPIVTEDEVITAFIGGVYHF